MLNTYIEGLMLEMTQIKQQILSSANIGDNLQANYCIIVLNVSGILPTINEIKHNIAVLNTDNKKQLF